MPKELEAHLINACGKKRRPTPRFYLAGNHWLLGGSSGSQNCTQSTIPYHFFKKRALFPTKQQKQTTYCNMFVAIKHHGNLFAKCVPQRKWSFFLLIFCFGNVGWRPLPSFFAPVFDGGKLRFRRVQVPKIIFSPENPGVLPSLKPSTAKSSRKLGRIPKGNQKSIPTIHFQVLWLFEFLVSGSSYDLFDTFLCRSVYHSQKESFLCFFVVFERIFFFEKQIYGASIN